jgi:integrase
MKTCAVRAFEVREFDHSDTSAESHVAHIPAHVLVLVARQGRAGKVIAQLMGHANVDTTLNVYTQVLDGSLRAAADKVGSELFTSRRKQALAL